MYAMSFKLAMCNLLNPNDSENDNLSHKCSKHVTASFIYFFYFFNGTRQRGGILFLVLKLL